MIDLTKLGKIKSEGSKFKETHPKFTEYILNLFGNRIEEGGELEVAYTTPDGKRVSGKIKVKETDIEFLKTVKNIVKG